MSCLTTSATRRSWMVPAAVLIASAAASSHEVPLVPMTSVTLYTLMTLSFDGLPAWAPRRSAGRHPAKPRPGAGSDRYVRRSPPDLSLALSPGDVQVRCPADPRPCRAGPGTRNARFCRRPGDGPERRAVGEPGRAGGFAGEFWPHLRRTS